MKTQILLLTLACGFGACPVASLSAEDGKPASPPPASNSDLPPLSAQEPAAPPLSAPTKPVPAPAAVPVALPDALLDGSFRKTLFFEVASLDSVSTAFVAALAQNFETSLASLFPDALPANSDGPRNIRI
jgi:hypothetical protein